MTAASDFADAKSLPSSPWSCKKLPFDFLPAAILVRDIPMTQILAHVRAVCDVNFEKRGPLFKKRRDYGTRAYDPLTYQYIPVRT